MDSQMAAAAVEVIDRHTSAMLAELRGLLIGGPSAPSQGDATASESGTGSWSWVEVERLSGQTYRWPDGNGGLETYDPFVVYRSNGLTLAVAPLTNRRERDQTWVFKMSDDLASKRPVTPFLAAD